MTERLSPIGAAIADPWDALRFVLGEPLHPGGAKATADLMDRAGVTSDTRLLDVGCGAAGALSLARQRGARAVGLDRRPDPDPDAVADPDPDSGSDSDPEGADVLRGDLTHLPVRDGSVDVVLAECALCLSPDLPRSLAEARRVLVADGRLALSDVVVEGDVPELPDPFADALCLSRARDREDLVASIERAGLGVDEVCDHQEDLIAMRDRAADRVDYEGLLGAIGDRGQDLLEGIERLETAIESNKVGYVSLVAHRR